METNYKMTLYVAVDFNENYFAICNKEGKPIWHDKFNPYFLDTQLDAEIEDEISVVRRVFQVVRYYELEKRIIIKELEILTSEERLLNFKDKKALSIILLDYGKLFDFNININYVTPKENFANKYVKPTEHGYYNINRVKKELLNQ